MVEKIAKIESTFLGYEDHGILTAYVHLDYGGLHQGAGGYALDQYDEESKARVGHRCGIDFVAGVLRACGVDSWEKLTGRTVFALIEDKDERGFGIGWGGKILGLKPLPTEDGEPFLFADAFASLTKVAA